MPRTIRAVHDPGLTARVVRRAPLLYADGADPAQDRPAHVRAASSLAHVDGVLAVVQDDANFIAIVHPATGAVRALPLPRGADGGRQFDDVRGNKHLKLDLEASAVVPWDGGQEALLAFGSGSSAEREFVAVVLRAGSDRPTATLLHLPALYARLRAECGFAGSEMNVEAAAWQDGRVHLFSRGNGAPAGGRLPVDATCALGWPELRAHLADPQAAPPPAPRDVARYELGALGGVRLGFTAAAPLPGGRRLFAAAAEDSPNAVDDGPVTGSALGVIEADGAARWGPITDEEGAVLLEKVEGITPGDAPDRVLAVADRDAPDHPCELFELALDGPWAAPGR